MAPLLHDRIPGGHYAVCDRSPALMRENGEELAASRSAVTCAGCNAALRRTAARDMALSWLRLLAPAWVTVLGLIVLWALILAALGSWGAK